MCLHSIHYVFFALLFSFCAIVQGGEDPMTNSSMPPPQEISSADEWITRQSHEDVRLLLHVAASDGRIDVLKSLLDRGVQINFQDKNGNELIEPQPFIPLLPAGSTLSVKYKTIGSDNYSIMLSHKSIRLVILPIQTIILCRLPLLLLVV